MGPMPTGDFPVLVLLPRLGNSRYVPSFSRWLCQIGIISLSRAKHLGKTVCSSSRRLAWLSYRSAGPSICLSIYFPDLPRQLALAQPLCATFGACHFLQRVREIWSRRKDEHQMSAWLFCPQDSLFLCVGLRWSIQDLYQNRLQIQLSILLQPDPLVLNGYFLPCPCSIKNSGSIYSFSTPGSFSCLCLLSFVVSKNFAIV